VPEPPAEPPLNLRGPDSRDLALAAERADRYADWYTKMHPAMAMDESDFEAVDRPTGELAERPEAVSWDDEVGEEPLVRAAEIEVALAEAEGRGAVTVHRSVVERGEGPLVVTGVRGFQYGSGNHQDNMFLFRMNSPEVPVGKLLANNPRVGDCLTKVAEHPMNPIAHLALRFAFRGGRSLYSQGCIESSVLKGRQKEADAQRIPLGADEGELVVENTQAVQVGCGGTQHNEYTFQVEEAELAIEAALASNYWLAWKFATAMANPDTEAAQRSFTRALVWTVGRVEGEISELAWLHGSLADSIDQADAVQAGSGNTRRDTAVVRGEGFHLLNWEEAAGFEEGRHRRETAEYQGRDREQRMEAKSEADEGEDETEAEEAAELARSIVKTLARVASEVTLSHVAPDREYLADRMTTAMGSALANVQPLEALPGEERTVSRLAPAESGADDVFEVRLVPLVPREPGQHGCGAGTGVTRGSMPPPPSPLGAVVWGAVRPCEAPEGNLLSRAQAMVDHLRRQLWAGRAGNTPEPVARALRAHRSLRAVLFLDPAAGEGLWVDMGPRGRAMAALLIRLDLSAELPGRFTAYGWAK